MSSVTVSIILPSVTDSLKFNRLCSTALSGRLSVELIVCTDKTNLTSGDLSEEYSDFISVVFAESIDAALKTAVINAKGQFIVFGNENAVYAPEAFEKMIVASQGKISACNVGFINSDGSSKLMSENFTVGDLGSTPVYCNYLISNDIIKKNSTVPCGADSLSIRLFISDCLRYENCVCFNEVLVYLTAETSDESITAIAYLPEYAEIFRLTGNSTATVCFINIVLSILLPNLTKENYAVLKTVVCSFKEDVLLLEYIRSKYRIDVNLLCNECSSFEDFIYDGKDVFYKEVTLPLLPDSVIRNFYSGKFGIDVLKKCIGAWMYFKFYRRKDDFVKKIGCKLSKKLLGGDFVG